MLQGSSSLWSLSKPFSFPPSSFILASTPDTDWKDDRALQDTCLEGILDTKTHTVYTHPRTFHAAFFTLNSLPHFRSIWICRLVVLPECLYETAGTKLAAIPKRMTLSVRSKLVMFLPLKNALLQGILHHKFISSLKLLYLFMARVNTKVKLLDFTSIFNLWPCEIVKCHGDNGIYLKGTWSIS